MCPKSFDDLQFNQPDDEIIQWWDNVGDLIRTKKSIKKERKFRIAELMTIDIEEKRTGIKPGWPGFESAYVGCDVISQISADNDRRLKIEVKCSDQHINGAWFHVTRNEWKSAEEADYYIFHIWLINKKYRLARLNKKQVSINIPTDNGRGQWNEVKIPFNDYETYFLDR